MKTKNEKFVFENKKLSRKEKIKLGKLYLGIRKLICEETHEKGNNKEQRIKALEDNIIKVIKKYPELLHMTRYEWVSIEHYGVYYGKYSEDGETILYDFLHCGLENVLKELCQDIEVCKLNVHMGWNIVSQLAFDCFSRRLDLLNYILDMHPELLSHQDCNGYNPASRIIKSHYHEKDILKKFEPYILESLKDEKIATQQDSSGYNIGMLCAHFKLQEYFDVAYKNAVAREQKNENGETMKIIANNNGLIVPPLTDEEVYDFYNKRIEEKFEEMLK